MKDAENFFVRAHALLDHIERLLPGAGRAFDATADVAWRWQTRGLAKILAPVSHKSQLGLVDLKCIDRQMQALERNTRQFLQNLPANHALLWGPRGTGKSSLVKALLNDYCQQAAAHRTISSFMPPRTVAICCRNTRVKTGKAG